MKPDPIKEDAKEQPADKVEIENEFQDTPFDRYKQAQETALIKLIGQLKQLKRDSVTKSGQDIQVLFSDVKEAPTHMQLIKDINRKPEVPEQQDQKKQTPAKDE